jgi:multicomponent Na+:H+ antiporter subunit D
MAIYPVLFIFIPIFTAVLIYLFKNEKFSNIVFVAQTIMITLFVFYAIFLTANPDQGLLILGGTEERIRISLYNDNLSLAFVGLTLIMFMVVLLYTFNTNKKENKFLFFLMFLQGVFLGLIQTNDLFNLFVFLELTTVLVTILIAYKKTGPSFRAAIYYLLLNTVGAMIFLIGIILVYYAFGTINIQYILANISDHSDTSTIQLAYVFMIAGISVKAALFPVFTWLPKAHGVAQSTISALLSGLIVKGALYMFIRINNQMFASANYQTDQLFFWVGTTTALVGVAFALSQKDLKQILAYSTVSQVGIMMMGISSLSALSSFGGLLHIFNHAFFKGLLFLGIGVVVKAYQSKKVYEVRGVFKTMPWTAILLIIGMLSVSGAPFFNGFVSKSLIKYDFKADPIKLLLFTVINIGTITYYLKLSTILFGPKKEFVLERNIKQHMGMTVLATLCIVFGVFYVFIGDTLFNIDLSYVKWFTFESFFDYLLYVGIGVLFYKYFINKDYLPTRALRTLNVTFETANYLFVIYLLVIAVFLMVL